MRWKDTVDFTDLKPVMIFAAYRVEGILMDMNVECWITSARDGKHKKDSLHYVGFALDFRTKDIQPNALPDFEDEVKRALGPQFDVVLEVDHLHVEWDVKGV